VALRRSSAPAAAPPTSASAPARHMGPRPSAAQRAWLRRGPRARTRRSASASRQPTRRRLAASLPFTSHQTCLRRPRQLRAADSDGPRPRPASPFCRAWSYVSMPRHSRLAPSASLSHSICWLCAACACASCCVHRGRDCVGTRLLLGLHRLRFRPRSLAATCGCRNAAVVLAALRCGRALK